MNASDDMTTTTNHHSVNHDFRRICSSKHDQATTRERKQRQLFWPRYEYLRKESFKKPQRLVILTEFENQRSIFTPKLNFHSMFRMFEYCNLRFFEGFLIIDLTDLTTKISLPSSISCSNPLQTSAICWSSIIDSNYVSTQNDHEEFYCKIQLLQIITFIFFGKTKPYGKGKKVVAKFFLNGIL